MQITWNHVSCRLGPFYMTRPIWSDWKKVKAFLSLFFVIGPVLDVEEASPENEEYMPDTDGAETEQKTQEEAADNKEDGEAEENSTEEKVEETQGGEERTEEQPKNKENTKGETGLYFVLPC
mgnify:CR=1 FL=1